MFMQLTKSLHSDSFRAKDNTVVPAELIPNLEILADNLQVLIDYYKAPIYILEAYRVPNPLKDTRHSYHHVAMACDFSIGDLTPDKIAYDIERLIEDGHMMQGGIGTYPNKVHYDWRGWVARWTQTRPGELYQLVML